MIAFFCRSDVIANGHHLPVFFRTVSADGAQLESPRKSPVDEPEKLIVSHTREQVVQLCHNAVRILFDQNEDFSDRAKIDRTISQSYFDARESGRTCNTASSPSSPSHCTDTDDADARRNRHAYCRMIFELCAELLHEIYSPNVRQVTYPEWQKSKLIAKRFYRLHTPQSADEADEFIQRKVLELLNLATRQITYSKWRVPLSRHADMDQFELVLAEELRRTETNWINYDDDCVKIKFDIAQHIFEQLVDESLTECFQVFHQRTLLSSRT